MNAIAPGLKIGDQVVQGQKLGEVGGRGANSADDYPNHLHFAVIYDNADLTLNYNGAPAVVDGNWGKYINPICFISNDYLKQNNIQLTFQNSKACTATCDLNGKCSMYPNVQSQAYKFCDLYGNVLPSNKFCQLSSNSDWKISNMNVYPAKVSGDQTVNIQLTIENSGDSCATVYPDIEILDSNNLRVPGSDSWDWQIDKVDVYKKNNIIAFENTAPISCSFDTNAQNAADARKNGRCVLLAPSDNSVMKYKVVAIAKDVKGRVVSTKDFATTIEITKPQSSNVQQNTAASNAQTDSTVTSASQSSLTSAEQKKFDKVKSILESNKLPDGTSYIQYIEKISALDNVPKEIALGVITQESSGSLASVSSAGATGLGNVMPATFNGLKFDNKCTWEQYKSDAACQIRASVSYLKQLYDEINGRTIYYKCAAYCYDAGSTRVCQEAVDFQYTGWEAVLRRYNGAHDYSPKQQTSGCTGSPDFLYVPHVMRWANAWGYTQAATYKTVSKDEIMKGVIGTFYFKPSFDVKIGLDLSVFSNLSDFMNSTAKKCAATSATVGKGQCIDNAIAEFNKDVASKYSGISLTRDCESSSDEKTADSVIESIEDCASSNDVNCQCTLPQTQSGMMIHIEGNSGYTLFSKIAKDNSFNIMSYQTFFNDQDKAQVSQDISLDALKVYKVKDGFKIGSVGNQNSNFCQSTKNEFKMCLKTGYDVSVMDNGKISEKNILLKFAISIRDALAPAPIAGLDLFNKLHSHDSVVVTWTPGKEKDIIRYNIYLGDSANDFSKSTDNYRQKLPYRGFNIPNKEYDIYDNIKFSDEPECSLNYDPNNNPYCKFLYNAIDKDGNNVKIELVDNKLYYLQNIDKFLYILDGNDAYNKLSDKKNKFIAVTAIDSDGNEINNTKDGEKISLNNNLKSILVKDLLEPGLVKPDIVLQPQSSGTKIALSWTKQGIYVDGKSIAGSPLVKYNVYKTLGDCTDGEFKQIGTATPELTAQDITASFIIPKLPNMQMDYCIYVTSSIEGKQYMEGFGKKIIV